MSTINFSRRAAKSLRDDEEELKRKTVRKLQKVREDPTHHLSPIEDYPFHKVEIGNRHVAIVDWSEGDDEIRVLTVGSRDSFHSPKVVEESRSGLSKT